VGDTERETFRQMERREKYRELEDREIKGENERETGI